MFTILYYILVLIFIEFQQIKQYLCSFACKFYLPAEMSQESIENKISTGNTIENGIAVFILILGAGILHPHKIKRNLLFMKLKSENIHNWYL